LTYSGWLTHISGHPSATSRAQNSESTSAKDQCSTAGPRNQRAQCCLGEGDDDENTAQPIDSVVCVLRKIRTIDIDRAVPTEKGMINLQTIFVYRSA